MRYDVIVLGAGAAGLMCAAEAGKRGRRTVVLEAANESGKKILISGGGRCNFTNLHCKAENFLSANRHFAKSALARYTQHDFIELVKSHRIPFHEKTLGQLFCDRSARDVVRMLADECRAAAVEVITGCRITEVRRTTEYVVESSKGNFQATAAVVATGGLSIPKLGATGLGYDIARQFGVRVVPTRAALVPFTFIPEDCRRWCDLAGVAADVNVLFGSQSFRERMLITHRGLSGPSMLQISSYWDGAGPIAIDLLPDGDIVPDEAKASKSILSTRLPRRFAERWLETYGEAKDWTEMNRRLRTWSITPAGTEGYAKAEVTAGGVDTAELSSKTMESRVPGLYFIGEVVDVTGWLGGYNFQWAWSSGVAAGRAI